MYQDVIDAARAQLASGKYRRPDTDDSTIQYDLSPEMLERLHKARRDDLLKKLEHCSAKTKTEPGCRQYTSCLRGVVGKRLYRPE